MTWPPATLTRAARRLEPRFPGLVRLAQATADRVIEWRVSWRYRRYPDPGVPWTPRYVRHQRRAVGDALGDEELLRRFADGSRLPPRYAIGLDERVIEYPWLVAKRPTGRVLDAGATTNYPHVLERWVGPVDEVVMVTLEPGAPAASGSVSYIRADLRKLPFGDAVFDTVLCISTLEHIGMDNSRWRVAEPRADEPERERRTAVAELRRVTASGGRALITVPYGVPEERSWFKQFDRHAIEALIEAFEPRQATINVYRYSSLGWQVSDLEEAAHARYQADSRPARKLDRDDMAAAARAVACLELVA
jgi:SAM-dependent methyltransferase